MSEHYVNEQPKQPIDGDGSELYNLLDCEVVYPGGLPPPHMQDVVTRFNGCERYKTFHSR